MPRNLLRSFCLALALSSLSGCVGKEATATEPMEMPCSYGLCIRLPDGPVRGSEPGVEALASFRYAPNFAFSQIAANEDFVVWQVIDPITPKGSSIAAWNTRTGVFTLDPMTEEAYRGNPMLDGDVCYFLVTSWDGDDAPLQLMRWDLAQGTLGEVQLDLQDSVPLGMLDGWMLLYNRDPVDMGLSAFNLDTKTLHRVALDPAESQLANPPAQGSVEWYSKLGPGGHLYWSDPSSTDAGGNRTRILQRTLPDGPVTTAYESSISFNDFAPLSRGFLLQRFTETWIVGDGPPRLIVVDASTFGGIASNDADWLLGSAASRESYGMTLVDPDGRQIPIFVPDGSNAADHVLNGSHAYFFATAGDRYEMGEWTLHRFELPK